MSTTRRALLAAVATLWPKFDVLAQAGALSWVVSYPPGGGADALARTRAETMRSTLGISIVVENKPGASTDIAAQDVAHVRAHPGRVNYASPGAGSPHHLAMEMFKQRTKTLLVHTPCRGAAPAVQEVMACQMPVMFLDLALVLTTIQGGKVRALAHGGTERAALLPGVPTLIESKLREVEVFAFQGLLGPAGRPAARLQRLNGELNKASANTTVPRRLLDFDMAPMLGTPD